MPPCASCSMKCWKWCQRAPELWKGKHGKGNTPWGCRVFGSSNGQRVCCRMSRFGTGGSKVVSPKPNMGKGKWNQKQEKEVRKGYGYKMGTANWKCKLQSFLHRLCASLCCPCRCSSSSPPAPELHCIHLQQLSGFGNFFYLGTRVWFVLQRNVVHKCAVLNQTFLNFLRSMESDCQWNVASLFPIYSCTFKQKIVQRPSLLKSTFFSVKYSAKTWYFCNIRRVCRWSWFILWCLSWIEYCYFRWFFSYVQFGVWKHTLFHFHWDLSIG